MPYPDEKIMKTRIMVSAAVLCLLSSCSDLSNVNKGDLLVGIWKESCGKSETIILRSSDGTYRQKSLKNNTASEEKEVETSSGEWGLRGDVYFERITYISNNKWEKFIGRKFEMEINSISSSRFRYYSTDNADCEQIKVGPANIGLFDRLVSNLE
jgi:hypothetical protein